MAINVSVQYNGGSLPDIIPPVLPTCYNHFIPIVSVGKRGAYQLVHGDLPRQQHSFGTTFRFTGPVPADSRQ